MSNFNEYISKLNCAQGMALTIERIKKLLQLTEDEYAFWQREAGLRRQLKHLNSNDVQCLIYKAYQKHHTRREKKEAP